jgi:hypothetical protein
MDTVENQWRRERDEFMHPRYMRARLTFQILRFYGGVEVINSDKRPFV